MSDRRKHWTPLAGAALAAFLSLAPNALADGPAGAPPLRHLVYSFTYGQEGDLTVHNETGYLGNTTSGAPGMHDYNGTVHDNGTITIDVVREQPDTGLIVTISEQATQTRRSDPATCVTYGTTNVICDPNKMVNSEELTLLRFLGRNFVDPTKLDEKGHWRVDESNAAVATTSDYTIAPGKNGVVSIQETRVVKNLGALPVTTNVSTTIDYDVNRQVPTTVQEYTIRRESSSATGLMKTTVQTTLNLISDSMAKS